LSSCLFINILIKTISLILIESLRYCANSSARVLMKKAITFTTRGTICDEFLYLRQHSHFDINL